jgi:predicted amidohydrolase
MGETSDGTVQQAQELGSSLTERTKGTDKSPILDKFKDIARTNDLWLSLGGFHELVPDVPGKIHNTHIILDNEGLVRAIYRKVHMFRVSIEGGPNLDETRTTIPGSVCVHMIEGCELRPG